MFIVKYFRSDDFQSAEDYVHPHAPEEPNFSANNNKTANRVPQGAQKSNCNETAQLLDRSLQHNESLHTKKKVILKV